VPPEVGVVLPMPLLIPTEVAFELVQVSVEEFPSLIVAGDAESVQVAGGAGV